MHRKLFTAIQESVQEISETMLFLEIQPGPAIQGCNAMRIDISAIVGFTGGMNGIVRLACPNDAAIQLASALIDEEIPEISEEGKDALAELANMITGGVQTRLAEELEEINLTPPVIVDGDDHHTHAQHDGACINHQFQLNSTSFFVEISYKTNN